MGKILKGGKMKKKTDAWHVVKVDDEVVSDYFCYNILFKVNCSKVVEIKNTTKIGGFHGFWILINEGKQSNSHFESEISRKHEIYIYPFRSRKAADCERMEIQYILERWQRREEARDRRNKKVHKAGTGSKDASSPDKVRDKA